MASFLIAIGIFVLVMLALGLASVLRGPAAVDRMMSAQLLGTSSIAALLLLSAATRSPAIVDVALSLALLAAFASVAFVTTSSLSGPAGDEAQNNAVEDGDEHGA
jgi:multicomponent Na+:H+ antiporter subunit F